MPLPAARRPRALPMVLLLVAAPGLAAQEWPEADPADVASVDAVITALYDVISGPVGETRDWERFRSLFIPEARLIPTGTGPDGVAGYRVSSPAEYADIAQGAFDQTGFFEIEIARAEERFGPVAHAFSTYESRRAADDPEPFSRGINSIQLFHDGSRWRVVTIFWSGERPDLAIPERYLPNGGSR